MFLDASRFSIARELAAHAATLQAELAGLAAEDYVPWPERAAFEGDWRLFPLVSYEPYFDGVTDYERNRRRCPRSWAAIGSMPRVRMAGFSWLGPRSHIFRHVDAYYHGLIRVQMGLRVPGQALMRYGTEVKELSPGLVLVVDGQTPHESANLSDEPRINLLLDFAMTEEEHSFVLEVSPFRRQAAEAWARSRSGASAT